MSEEQRPCSQHSSFYGWKVEARINANQPVDLGGEIFDSKWRFVRFTKAAHFGVPNPSLYAHALDQCDLFGYEQAQALRWWFHANFPFTSGLETRLASYKVESDVKWLRTSSSICALKCAPTSKG